MGVIWLASYPRSGNTFLRTMLWHCFGLRSASVYPDDLRDNDDLKAYVGHIEPGPDGQNRFGKTGTALVKTHEPPGDRNPAIYVIRDGRAASVSLWHFYGCKLPLDAIIEGRHRFGVWSAHVHAWAPDRRPNTLLLKYEDMVRDLPTTLQKISIYLKRDIVTDKIPERKKIAGIDGRWVKNKSDWRTEISEELKARFTELNGEMLNRMGYT